MNAKKYSIAINGSVELAIAGRYFKLLSSSTVVDVELLNDGNRALAAVAIEGGFYQRIPFTTVRITTPSNQQVDFLVAPEEGGSDRFTGVVAISGSAHVQTSVTVGAASAQVLAANSGRKYLSIQNQHATDPVYIRTDGGAATIAAASFKLEAGQTWEPCVAPTGQVNAIRGAAAVDLNVIEA